MPMQERVRVFFGSDGPLADVLEGFQPREGQVLMAEAITRAMASQSSLLVEAGTGIGKTFAYLVPALLSGSRVIVSTGTRHLQDQLFHKDLPLVARAIGEIPKAMMLKGRSNYVCLQRLAVTQRAPTTNARKYAAELELIKQWTGVTRSGDVAELTEIPEHFPLWSQVTSTVDNCLGQNCPDYDDCFVMAERRRAQRVDVLVVNHHLMFADMALKTEGYGEVLPPADLYVMDEAHQIPETASRFFGRSVSSRQLLDLGRDALNEAGSISAGLSLMRQPVEALEEGVRRLRLAMEGLPKRAHWGPAFERVSSVWEVVAIRLDDLLEVLSAQSERSPGLAACDRRGRQIRQTMKDLSEPQALDVVQWYELRGRGFAVNATPLDISAPFRAFRETLQAAWVFTSATLAVGEKFELFAGQLGLDAPDTEILPSPFDYAHNALMYLPGDLPEPGHPQYTKMMIEAMIPVLHASAGRAFLLFTSHRALNIAAGMLRTQIDMPLFVQGSAPKAELLEAFRNSGNGVLLGAASFWEGVDVRGTALSCVIMDKLPFAAPDDPMTQARIEALQNQGKNAFMQFQLPQALLAAKQGAGRLIRDPDDHGVLVVCDPRIRTKPYGVSFLKALPPMPRTQNIEAVEDFFVSLLPS